MNELLRPDRFARTTQAAEGLPRWRWTTAELVRLTELGAFGPEERFELIGGEIVPMSPIGRRHEVLAEDIEDAIRAQAGAGFRVRTELQFNLASDAYAKPDIFVHATDVRTADVRGATVLLVIEVSDASLGYDLGGKAALYAGYGVREYWVVDARTLITHVHRAPGANGYAAVTEHAADATLTPFLVPGISFMIGALRLE